MYLKRRCSCRALQDPFLELDAEAIEKEVNAIYRTLQRSMKYFENHKLDGCTKVAKEIFDQVAEFRPQVPLIVALRQPGMRDRHWDEVSAKAGKAVRPGPKYTLSDVFEDKLADNLDIITKISEIAGKEFSIETSLDTMLAAWQGVPLQVEEYRATGTCILKGIDEYMALLDEQITMTQAMTFSAFKGPFEERIDEWNTTLQIVSEVVVDARIARDDSVSRTDLVPSPLRRNRRRAPSSRRSSTSGSLEMTVCRVRIGSPKH